MRCVHMRCVHTMSCVQMQHNPSPTPLPAPLEQSRNTQSK